MFYEVLFDGESSRNVFIMLFGFLWSLYVIEIIILNVLFLFLCKEKKSFGLWYVFMIWNLLLVVIIFICSILLVFSLKEGFRVL